MQSDHAIDATRSALFTEPGEHAATEAYLAETLRYVKSRARSDEAGEEEEGSGGAA